MRGGIIIDLSVGEIMARWPSTIRVFIAYRMHCVGCPISPFHTLVDAAEEHRNDLEDLCVAVEAEIELASIAEKAGASDNRARSADSP